jgi:hypothetical protein
MGQKVFRDFEDVILAKTGKQKQPSDKDTDNKGKLLVDATVAEQSVKYPTDINLLNEAREISEKLIDELYEQANWAKKPRTYRQKARRQYLLVAKNKRPSLKIRRRGIREQLQYLRRNLGHITTLLDYLGSNLSLCHTNSSGNTGSSSSCMNSKMRCTTSEIRDVTTGSSRFLSHIFGQL